MLTPKQIDRFPENLVELYSQAEIDIIKDIARRISTYDYFIPSAEWQYKKLLEMGNVHDEMILRLSEITGKTEKEIKKLMLEAGYEAVKFDDKIYKKAGLDLMPIDQSPALLNTVEAGIRNTNGLFQNLTRTTANTASKQFENILDNAYMQITTGAFDYNTAIRNAIKDLTSKGLASITYPSGYTSHLESAVRRAVITGVNQTALKMQETRAQEMGSDLVETTAHAGARNTGEGPANHQNWQGKVFSLSGSHPKYPDFRKETGYGTGEGLGGWNCRHSFYPFFEGLSEPAYTDEELKDYNAENYEYNGKKMTEYEASQKQRYIESKIRRWKREYIGMEAAGLSTEEAASKISRWQEIQKDFLNQTGLKKQTDREQIARFGRSEAQKVNWFTRKEKERAYYETTIKPKQPKVAKADDIELKIKTEYDIVKDGITTQGVVPSGVTATKVHVMAGYGSSDNIRVAKELSKKYDGDYWKWQKKTGTVESTYRVYEIHWYEYAGKQYESKLKRVKEK